MVNVRGVDGVVDRGVFVCMVWVREGGFVIGNEWVLRRLYMMYENV